MWQNNEQNFDLLDIITMLSLAMQVAADEQSKRVQQQINRIEHKVDKLLFLLGEHDERG